MPTFLSEHPVIAPLTRNEKTLPEAKYYYKPIARPPKEVMDAIDNKPMDPALAIPVERMEEVIFSDKLPVERGWCVMPNGSGYVVGTTPFPGSTPEMLPWWFSWFPLDSLRQKMWCPEQHQGQIAAVPTRARLRDYSLPPKERVVGARWYGLDTGMSPESNIDPGINSYILVSAPEDFGLDSKAIEDTGSTIMCMNGVPNASFIHVAHPTDYGFELRSHMWFGYQFKDKKPVLNETLPPREVMANLCHNQFYHLLDEYYRLADILPDVYNEFSGLED